MFFLPSSILEISGCFIPTLKANSFWLRPFSILVSFIVKYNKKEYLFFLFGFIGMIVSEYLFISTGVETFNRNSLFGLMPLWLPFLWGYAFVVMKRVIVVLDN